MFFIIGTHKENNMKKFFDLLMTFKVLPRDVFIKSKTQLIYVNVTKIATRIIIGVLILGFTLGLLVGSMRTKTIVVKKPTKIDVATKYDLAIGDLEWKDSIFLDYNIKANLYLSQEEFAGTPINGDMLSLAARNAYDSTGVILPLELALAQAQWESNMGRAGRSPINNPYNVGEWDNGTVYYFATTFDGIQAYYYLMCNNYLSCKSLNELFVNFVNCNGARYASSPTYEHSMKYQYYHIQQWINENI